MSIDHQKSMGTRYNQKSSQRSTISTNLKGKSWSIFKVGDKVAYSIQFLIHGMSHTYFFWERNHYQSLKLGEVSFIATLIGMMRVASQST